MSLTKDLPSHQQEINNSHNGCVCLESESDQVQEIERLRKENVAFLKSKREIERKLREETQAFEKARVVWKERETEFLDQLKVLHETISVLAQQNKQALERRDEENSYSAVTRELKSVQKSNKELERRNSDLTAELEKAKREANESVNTIKIHVRRIRELEDELSQAKHMNQSLMEDNKSYQQKMFEKTIKGEFNPLSQSNDSHEYTKETTDGISENNLETELTEPNSSLHSERVHKESDNTIVDKLQREIKSLNDTNKEMKSYIEKILNQIIDKQGFEEILSFEKKSSPTSGSFGFNNNNNNNNNNNYYNYNNNSQEKTPTRKVERHKTLPSSFKTDKESYVSLPSRKSNDDTPSDVQKRGLRRSSTLTRNTKRFSIFGWGGGVEEKKEDPFMKPMFLLQQEQDRKECN